MDKIIQTLIDSWTKGVDTYTHNGSTWLIFTDNKQWVIELTESKILWYNYNFFKQIFEFTSLDVVDNQHYITKWVEDNIINKELTYVTLFRDARDRKQQFENTLENGVKYTKMAHMKTDWSVEDTIENGVKKTDPLHFHRPFLVKDTDNGSSDKKLGDINDIIQNGVRDTQYSEYENQSWINGVIKEGVKETKSDDFNVSQFLCEEVIDKGVKETNHVDVMKFFDNKMEDALKNGVKETKQKKNALLILDTSGRELILESHLVVRDGVKKTNYDTDNYTDDVEEVIKEGVKSSNPRQYVGENIIDKVIDKGVIETHREICEYKHTVDYIIQTGVKETHDDVYHHKGRIDGVIKNGIKETKTPGKDGNIVSTVEWMKENNSNSYPKMIDDVIENGEKINGTYAGGQRQSIKCKSVVEYGTKTPTV